MKNICLLILTFIALPVLASGESQQASYEKYNSKNMSGWKGIVFICLFDSNDKVLQKICRRAETDIELLAANNNVALKIANANDTRQAAYIAGADKYITLEYDLMATQIRNDYDVQAVHARLRYEIVYSNAIEKGSKPDSIDNLPRSGDLAVWSRSVIGSGVPANIVEPFSDGAETYIKKALTFYLKYNR